MDILRNEVVACSCAYFQSISTYINIYNNNNNNNNIHGVQGMDIDIELLDDIIAELCSMWTEALSTLDPLTNTPTQTSAGQISGPGAIHTGTYVSLKVGHSRLR
jgi:hypothetical protein